MKLKSIIAGIFAALLLAGCSLGGGTDPGNGGTGLHAPVGLQATGTSQTSIKLSWTPVSGAAKYKVYYSVTGTGQYRYLDETEEQNYIATGLTSGKTWYFKVSSVGTDGVEGPLSTYAHADTHAVNTPIPVTGVSLDKTSFTLEIGQSITLVATISPDNATNKEVKWTTSDSKIAKGVVEGNNSIVTGVSAGTAFITATSLDGEKAAVCTVTVIPAAGGVTGVSLNKTSLSLEVGASETLTATISPASATNTKVDWTSSDTNIVKGKVSGNSVTITAVAPGTAIITVKTDDGGHTAACTVTVTPASKVPVTGVSLNKSTLALQVGASETLIATVSPANATDKSVAWVSNKSEIARVGAFDGVVTAVAEGTAIITVMTVDGVRTAACTVTVSAAGGIPVTGVSVSKSSLALEVGASETITATVSPAAATNKKLKWTTGNSGVATGNYNSNSNSITITGHAVGTANISVWTDDGNYTATCAVTVVSVKIPVTGVSLDKTGIVLEPGGKSETIFATVSPASASNPAIQWETDNAGVATVNYSASRKCVVITAKAGGTAIITVRTDDGNYTAACTVTVTSSKVPVTGLSLDRTSLVLDVGASETITATISPASATDKAVTWTQTGSSVATGNYIGTILTITAVAPGTATFTAGTPDGAYTAQCTVTVR